MIRVKTKRIEIRLKEQEKKFIQLSSKIEEKNMTDYILNCIYFYENSKRLNNEKKS